MLHHYQNEMQVMPFPFMVLIFIKSYFRFVNALCYLLDWKFLMSLEIVSLMLVRPTSQLYWKSAKVKCFVHFSFCYLAAKLVLFSIFHT